MHVAAGTRAAIPKPGFKVCFLLNDLHRMVSQVELGLLKEAPRALMRVSLTLALI